ncbi:MAG: hypothetical protein KJZ80_08985 [Hyphomicrobiaceae bacterium]|nr:hypothetical protein [Hyphomicrobiaceae bacterium]
MTTTSALRSAALGALLLALAATPDLAQAQQPGQMQQQTGPAQRLEGFEPMQVGQPVQVEARMLEGSVLCVDLSSARSQQVAVAQGVSPRTGQGGGQGGGQAGGQMGDQPRGGEQAGSGVLGETAQRLVGSQGGQVLAQLVHDRLLCADLNSWQPGRGGSPSGEGRQ